MLYFAMAIGGFFGIWLLQALIDWLFVGRIMDDPLKGKLLATISAYFIAAILYSSAVGGFAGFLVYLPGAILVGLIEMRNARKIQEKIDAADETTTFE